MARFLAVAVLLRISDAFISFKAPPRTPLSRGASQLRMAISSPPAELTVPLGSDETSLPGITFLREALEERGVGPAEVELLLSTASTRKVDQGEALILEGELIDSKDKRELFCIADGRAQIEIRNRKVATLGPGAFAGEASFVSKTFGPRSATVRASVPLIVLVWESGALRSVLAAAENSELRNALLDLWTLELAKKLHKVMNRYDVAPNESPGHAHGQFNGVNEEKSGSVARNYGYRSIMAEAALGRATPVSAAKLAWWTFTREYKGLRRAFRFEEFASNTSYIPKLFAEIDRSLEQSVTWLFPRLKSMAEMESAMDGETQGLQAALKQLKLSNVAIADREKNRWAKTKDLLRRNSIKGLDIASEIRRTPTPFYIMLPYQILCGMLDVLFEDRPIQRFWFLETVARMPYFSYQSMLHLYESLGWFTIGNDVRKVHFAEEINEAQHLLIMESLGGDSRWVDRFLARHAAILYYWVLNVLFLVSPFLAYNFSELLESHAVDTYSEFLDANKELLKSLPPSEQALQYYMSDDLYLFDEFQTGRAPYSRRPVIRNLYDVFENIRNDELEHVKTMFACERSTEVIRSPNDAAAQALWSLDVDELTSEE